MSFSSKTGVCLRTICHYSLIIIWMLNGVGVVQCVITEGHKALKASDKTVQYLKHF
jgi:hypothetical protein